mgnify:CR=1 FL=1|tara:strand:- start:627 stop:1175 length:549 start_codon:yes stop_codon:yes gene_type:complete
MMQVKLSFINPELREAPYTIITVRTEMRKRDKPSFDLNPLKNHTLTQSLLGALLLAPIILIFEEQNLLIVASLGSTIFVVLAIPSSKSARARNVLLGHFIGLSIGSISSLITIPVIPAVIAVGITMLLMIITRTAHAPATGTALALSGSTVISFQLASGFLIVLALIAIIHQVGKPYLRDLV